VWTALAIVLFGAAFATALGVVRAGRRRPLALAAPLAFATLIAFEAILLNLLSLWNAVDRLGVLVGHVVAVAGVALVAAFLDPPLRLDPGAAARGALRAVRRTAVPGILVAGMAALLVASAARYEPNNRDSMTYHLARVAHWIQNGSVAPYPTNINRQNLLSPGAEYLLLGLQVVSGTDRLANFVQLVAWLMLVCAAPPLARLAGAPRRLAPWAAVLVAALPMGVLQATSTQNDLVAAVAAVAIVITSSRFVHGAQGRWRGADATLLAVALASAAVVKVNALVATAPLLGVAAARTAIRAARGREAVRGIAVGLGLMLAVCAAVVGPVVPRQSGAEARWYREAYMYPMFGDLGDRVRNVLRGLARHVPVAQPLVAPDETDTQEWCSPGDVLCGPGPLRAHEDYAGNPVHVAIFAVAGLLVLVRRGAIPPRALAFAAMAATAWVLSRLTFRDNFWISRIETPAFVLGSTAATLWGARASGRWLPVARWGTIAAAVVAFAFGIRTAARNELRPPLDAPRSDPAATYYVSRPVFRPVHDAVLAAATELGCERVGLALGSDSYDYPLTWRAMQRGIAVRHLTGRDPWPCLVFTDQEAPSASRAAELGWRPTSVPFLYLNGAASAP
jgi:hypothetical protein